MSALADLNGNLTVQYGQCRLRDLALLEDDQPEWRQMGPAGRPCRTGKQLPGMTLAGKPVQTCQRFWTSLQQRFGFSANIFNYFSPAEVFERISEVARDDSLRWCLERNQRQPDAPGTLLAVTGPQSPVLPLDDLYDLLAEYDVHGVTYHEGVVFSTHTPKGNGGDFLIAGDAFQNRFELRTPIDGYGRPSIHLAMLRLICENGAVAYSPIFRSELALGRGENSVTYALQRALEGFNNEEGYAALRNRFEAATRSWASVADANSLYKALVRSRMIGNNLLPEGTVHGGEGSSHILHRFHQMTGDVSQLYGLANFEALSVKRQRTLPIKCKVYDLINFASEVATHRAREKSRLSLQAFIGDIISEEYDLEGTADQFSDYRDFFLGHEATAQTLADRNRRS